MEGSQGGASAAFDAAVLGVLHGCVLPGRADFRVEGGFAKRDPNLFLARDVHDELLRLRARRPRAHGASRTVREPDCARRQEASRDLLQPRENLQGLPENEAAFVQQSDKVARDR